MKAHSSRTQAIRRERSPAMIEARLLQLFGRLQPDAGPAIGATRHWLQLWPELTL